MPVRPLVAWCLFDGKPGHENQVMGLVNALGRVVPLNPYFLPASRSLINWLLGRFPAGKVLPDPDLLIGAGHGTHVPLLAARRARGGRIVLFMNPSVPTSWFDLCIIPEHDRPRPAANVLVSRGALSRVRPSGAHEPDRGLILIGGPSRNYKWSDDIVLGQVEAVLCANPEWRWMVTTSRRTPPSFTRALEKLPGVRGSANVVLVAWPETGSDWVVEQLARAHRVWVTEESVSMVYDALTAGAGVGLLTVPSERPGRVARGVQRLVDDGWVIPFDAWRAGRQFGQRGEPFDEAARCAEWIRDCWLDHDQAAPPS